MKTSLKTPFWKIIFSLSLFTLLGIFVTYAAISWDSDSSTEWYGPKNAPLDNNVTQSTYGGWDDSYACEIKPKIVPKAVPGSGPGTPVVPVTTPASVPILPSPPPSVSQMD